MMINLEKSEHPHNYPALRPAIKADVIRFFGKYRFWLPWTLFLFNRTFRLVCTLRLSQWASDLPGIFRVFIFWPFRIIHYIAQQLAAVDLPWRTQIGPGFRLTHGWGTVISPGAVIGKNVTLFHGVTIGQKDHISVEGRETMYPTIEDEVWIGPHAVIVGGVTVGCGSRIAPGTIVIKDVEPHSVVAGNPGQVIKSNVLPDVVFPAKFDTEGNPAAANVSWYTS
jgi:serine O-acetyltransferase